MATPRTTYESGYPDDKYQGNVQQERTESGRLVANARDYNKHDVEIQALQCFLGIATSSFDPTGPVPGSGETIVNKLTKISGTANCIEQSVICNFGGTNGIDPGGSVLNKTTESGITDMVTPPAGWVTLEPPDPSGVYCPPYPEDPPWNPPVPPGFPPYPVPDGYPWPQGFDPGVDDGFPLGPWMQWMHWAVGALMANMQVQNAQNIKLMPGGLIWNGVPDPWQGFIQNAHVFDATRDQMVVPEGQSIPDPSVTGQTSIYDAFDVTLSVLSSLENTLNINFLVLTGNGTTSISGTTLTPINLGVPSADHATILTVISPDDLGLTLDKVEVTAAQVWGIQPAGAFDFVFDTPTTNGSRIVIVYNGDVSNLVTDAPNTIMWFNESGVLVGGGSNEFTPSKVPRDGGGVQPIVTLAVDGVIKSYVAGPPGPGEYTWNGTFDRFETGDVGTICTVLFAAEDDNS